MRYDYRLTVAVVLLLTCGCREERATRKSAEAPVRAVAGELRLTDEMQQHLGLETQPAVKRTVRASISTTGWLEAAPGSEAVIKAPVAGFLRFQRSRQPSAGQRVDKGAELSTMLVFLSPQELAQMVANKEDTDIAIEQSLVSMRLAEEQLNKLKVAQDVVAGTRIIELREIYERAQAAYRESREKLPFLVQEPFDGTVLVKPVPIAAPLDGWIVQVHAVADQFVLPGDPLWTIADWSTMWLRVPVFEADLPRVLRNKSVEVAVPGTRATMVATPISVPVATKPRLRTVDLLFEVRNSADALRVGQAVSVQLPTGEPEERVVVSRTAVLWDGLGNAWVYLRTSSESFRRQKIEIRASVPDGVVVTRGLIGEEPVVISGAESLYGEEFKAAIPVGDDDD